MSSKSATDRSDAGRPSWRQAVAGYQSPDLRRSLGQIVNTFVPYIILWILMVRSLTISYWLTLALAVPAATVRSSNRNAPTISWGSSAAS